MRASVLFVCLGNICRSPLAEGAFRAEAARLGLDVTVDSAGTGGWHAGDPPDPRSVAVARRNGVDISSQRARKVSRDDFRTFTHIYALDHDNLEGLRAAAPRRAMRRRRSGCCWISCPATRAERWPIPTTATTRAST